MKIKHRPKRRTWHSPTTVVRQYESVERSTNAPVFQSLPDPLITGARIWTDSTRDIGNPIPRGRSSRTLTLGSSGYYTPIVQSEYLLDLSYSNLLPQTLTAPPDVLYLWPIAGVVTDSLLQYPTRLLYQEFLSTIPQAQAPIPLHWFRQWQERNMERLLETKVSRIHISLNSGFSLINFLLQWRDVVHIYKHYLTVKGLRERLHKLFSSRKGASGAAKAIADEVLEHNYGTAQFFRDAHTIWKIMCTWRKEADKLYAEAGQLRRKNFILQPETNLIVQEHESVAAGFDLQPGSVFRLSARASFHVSATLVYSYTMPKMLGFLSRLGQLADSFGVGLDPSIVWDGIPFTFCVDWFYNVGEWLHRQRLDWIQAEVTYKQFGTGAKLSYTRACDLIQPSGPSGELITTRIATQRMRYHERTLIGKLPVGAEPSLDNSERWSVTKITNATALGAQQVLRQKRVKVIQHFAGNPHHVDKHLG